ncbi:hypothetical protein HY385_01475 [Candidatus Daviesbacteria bacterium]|nr:hypothetical protein [Candidatus Daviesbacteria bacterium]
MMPYWNTISSQSGAPNWYPMMGGFGVFGWVAAIFWIITWALVLIAMVALIRWLWKKGGK